MLAALESLNCAVLTAMDTTKLVSGGVDGGRLGVRAGVSAVLWELPLSGLKAVKLEAWVQIMAFSLSSCAPFSLGLSFLICKLGIIIELTSIHLM